MSDIACCKIEIVNSGEADDGKDGKKLRSDDKTADELKYLSEQINKRENENKEGLKQLIQLTKNAEARKMQVQLHLQTKQKKYAEQKKDNKRMEDGVKDAIDGLGNADSDDEGGYQERKSDAGARKESLFDDKGKLRKDKSLPSKMEDMLKDLQNTLPQKRKRADDKRKECDDLQKYFDQLDVDGEDKKQQARGMRWNLSRLNKLYESLVDDVKSWLTDLYQTITCESQPNNDIPVEDAIAECQNQLFQALDSTEKPCDELDAQLKETRAKHDAVKNLEAGDAAFEQALIQLRQKSFRDIDNVLLDRETAEKMLTFVAEEENFAHEFRKLYKWTTKEIDAYQRKLETTARQADNSKAKSDKEREAQSDENANLDNELNGLKSELAKLNDENDQLQAQLDKKQFDQFQMAKVQQERWSALLNESTVFMTAHESLLQRLGAGPERQLEDENRANEDMEALLEKLQAKHDALQNQLSSVRDKIAEIKAKRLETKVDNNESIRLLQEKLRSLEIRKGELVERIEKVKITLREMAKTGEQLKEVSDRCDLLEKDVKAKESQIRSNKEIANRMTNDCESKENEAKYLNEKLDAVQNSNKTQERRVQRERETLQEINGDILSQVDTRQEDERQTARSGVVPEQIVEDIVGSKSIEEREDGDRPELTQLEQDRGLETVRRLQEDQTEIIKQELELTDLCAKAIENEQFRPIETAAVDDSAMTKEPPPKAERAIKRSKKPEFREPQTGPKTTELQLAKGVPQMRSVDEEHRSKLGRKDRPIKEKLKKRSRSKDASKFVKPSKVVKPLPFEIVVEQKPKLDMSHIGYASIEVQRPVPRRNLETREETLNKTDSPVGKKSDQKPVESTKPEDKLEIKEVFSQLNKPTKSLRSSDADEASVEQRIDKKSAKKKKKTMEEIC